MKKLCSFVRSAYAFSRFEEDLSLLVHPYLNKMTSFTLEERKEFGLEGLLPSKVETLELQSKRALCHLNGIENEMEKYIFLHSLSMSNSTLFYRLLQDNLIDITPIIYTPTVGEACLRYSSNFMNTTGLYIDYNMKGRIREVLDNWKIDPDIIVVTDGSRILGLGDLGINGMGIPQGKLSLYVAAAGFNPAHTLPIVIDVGTNNEGLLQDELYIGMRRKRIRGERFFSFMEEFMSAVVDKWPTALIQFEDFSNDVSFDLLEQYREDVLCFNDDIQGTGAVIVSGIVNAFKLSEIPAEDHKFLFYGAGSAAVGVADCIKSYLVSRFGIPEKKVNDMFYMVDSKGLLTAARLCGDEQEELEKHKLGYIRYDMNEEITDLSSIIDTVEPTCLIGFSQQYGAFDQKIIKKMGKLNERPIIFALSNPHSKCECTAAEAYSFTEGRAIFASGSKFEDWKDPNTGNVLSPGQGNNMYIFPGLGLGSVVARTRKVSDEMLNVCSECLANQVTDEDLYEKGSVYPDLNNIREISKKIAEEVFYCAIEEGLSHFKVYSNVSVTDMIDQFVYEPEYQDLLVHAQRENEHHNHSNGNGNGNGNGGK